MRYCKQCGGVLEWGLPYTDDKGRKVVRLWCYRCGRVVETRTIGGGAK